MTNYSIKQVKEKTKRSYLVDKGQGKEEYE
jgi:hypothetical protein